MKAVRISGERQAELIDLPDLEAKGEYMVVKIHATPMCTEYKAYRAGHLWQGIGHEAAGEVVEVAQPGKVKVGDRVAVMPQLPCGRCALCLKGEYIHCQYLENLTEATGYEGGNGTYAQYVLKQDWLLLPLPDGMSYEHAGMACCGLGPTFGAMQLMQVDAFDTVLVTGLGPVGLGAVVNAVYRAARVIGVEGQPFRANLAQELGAETVIDPAAEGALERLLELTDGLGVDKAVDCSGVAQAQRLCIDATRRKGHVAFVGEAGDLTLNVSQDMIRKGLTLHGTWHYNLGDSARIMQVIRGCGDLLDKQITHTCPMSSVQEAFELQLTGDCGKVVLYPWE